VTFSTDIFHPFLTPLTTYTYTTGATDSDTVSASDDERLPPGGFSLRHGFPHWFARSRRSATSSRTPSGQTAPAAASGSPLRKSETAAQNVGAEASNAAAASTTGAAAAVTGDETRQVCVAEVLKYIQSTFVDEAMLDSIPVETAANPGAYHAWRTYRGKDTSSKTESASQPASDASGRSRRPGEWNWEGVWEDRVRKGIKASMSDPVLFAGGTDEVRDFRVSNAVIFGFNYLVSVR
jgi:hypothetical protein